MGGGVRMQRGRVTAPARTGHRGQAWLHAWPHAWLRAIVLALALIAPLAPCLAPSPGLLSCSRRVPATGVPRAGRRGGAAAPGPPRGGDAP